jgi:MFS superfamily sulfate permease-like transporter
MTTSRSFAARNGYDIDADRDLAALGASNIAAAISQGFAVSGADSRTAMNDSAGGRTQVAGLVAAAAIALVLLVLTAPLKYVPEAALGAVLVMAAYSLVDIKSVRALWRETKSEFVISIVATLGVVAVGSIDAIVFAVVLALLRFVHIVAHPPCEVLGQVDGMPGFHSIARHPGARTIPGLCLFRFNSPIVFFNAPYFKRAALRAVAAADPGLRWLVFDAVPITSNDVTGRHTMRELEHELAARGVRCAMAGRQTEFSEWRQERGLDKLRPVTVRWFPTLRRAARTLQKELAAESNPP